MNGHNYWESALPFYRSELRMLFDLIEAGWALTDDDDDDGFLKLVDEGRNTHPVIQPRKELIHHLVNRGLIEFQETSQQFGLEREWSGSGDYEYPVPFVYFFDVTAQGKRWSESAG